MKRALASLGLLFTLVAPASAQGPRMIRRGEVLRWSASSGHGGLMKIVAVDGPLFEVEQINEKNRAAGAVRLYGALVDGGRRVVLLNVGQWREVWDGTLYSDEIRGNLLTGSSSLSFRITAAPEPPREEGPALFIPGRTLRWESGSGQNGTFTVTHAKGPFFHLEQRNFKNPAAGITRLEGEVKDGRVYLYNRKWNETWVGTFRRGSVVGRINDRTEFRIFE
jgi:hypothetical protein